MDRQDQASELFTHTYVNSLDKLRILYSLAILVEKGGHQVARDLATENVKLLEQDGQLRGLLASLGQSAQPLATAMANATVDDAKRSVDAAMLVFAHSTLDSVAMDLCRLIALLSPQDWTPIVEAKKLSLQEMQQTPNFSYEKALEAVLAKHLKQLENEKLLKKVDSVIARCHPESEWFNVPSYRFDPNRIEELDKKRIDIVHRDALGMHIPKALDSAEYLVRTALFLISLVGRRYGLQFDLRYLSFSYDKPITRT